MSGLGFLDGDEILRIVRFRCPQIPQPTWKNSEYVNGGEADAVLIVTKTRKRREIRIIALSASDYAKDSKNLNFYFANNKFGGFFFSPIISKVNTNDEVLINKYLNEYSWSNYKTQVLVKKNNREDWKYDKNSWSGLNEHPNVGPFETKLENNWKLIQDPFDPNNVPPQVLDMDLINHWEEYKIWLKEQREKPPTPKDDPSPIVDPVKDVIIPIKLERDLTFNVEKNLTFISGDLDIGELTIVRKEDPSDPKFITPINTNSYPDDYDDIYSENAFEGEDEIGLIFEEIDYFSDADDSSVNVDEGVFEIPLPKAGDLTISKLGIKRLRIHEGTKKYIYDDRTGLKVTSYSDVKGYPTIGVGHKIEKGDRSKFVKYLKTDMTDSEVDSLLLSDLAERIKHLNKILKVVVTQNQFDSLLSLMYNAGQSNGSFKKAIEFTNQGKKNTASAQIKSGPKTEKSSGKILTGLERRRNEEGDIYIS